MKVLTLIARTKFQNFPESNWLFRFLQTPLLSCWIFFTFLDTKRSSRDLDIHISKVFSSVWDKNRSRNTYPSSQSLVYHSLQLYEYWIYLDLSSVILIEEMVFFLQMSPYLSILPCASRSWSCDGPWTNGSKIWSFDGPWTKACPSPIPWTGSNAWPPTNPWMGSKAWPPASIWMGSNGGPPCTGSNTWTPPRPCIWSKACTTPK